MISHSTSTSIDADSPRLPRLLPRLGPISKRGAELIAATVATLLLLPVLTLVAIAIRLDSPGPVLFRQVRVGRAGRRFVILKFRTMVVDAEALMAELERFNEAPGGVLFRMRADPRVTRIGRLLRRSSLDELPQLINIILGHMSFVGPRPLTERDWGRLAAMDAISSRQRLAAQPGLTGLSQVSGRRDLDPDRLLELDVRYLDEWSLRLDLAILLKTLLVVVNGRGAA